MQQLLRTRKVLILKQGNVCTYLFYTRVYQTKTLPKGLEEGFKGNEGSVALRQLPTMVFRNLCKQKCCCSAEQRKMEDQEYGQRGVYGSSLNSDVYFSFWYHYNYQFWYFSPRIICKSCGSVFCTWFYLYF